MEYDSERAMFEATAKTSTLPRRCSMDLNNALALHDLALYDYYSLMAEPDTSGPKKALRAVAHPYSYDDLSSWWSTDL